MGCVRQRRSSVGMVAQLTYWQIFRKVLFIGVVGRAYFKGRKALLIYKKIITLVLDERCHYDRKGRLRVLASRSTTRRCGGVQGQLPTTVPKAWFYKLLIF